MDAHGSIGTPEQQRHARSSYHQLPCGPALRACSVRHRHGGRRPPVTASNLPQGLLPLTNNLSDDAHGPVPLYQYLFLLYSYLYLAWRVYSSLFANPKLVLVDRATPRKNQTVQGNRCFRSHPASSLFPLQKEGSILSRTQPT